MNQLLILKLNINVHSSSPQPFLEAVSLWSRLSITEQAVAANLSPGFLTSPHVIVPDLELSLKVGKESSVSSYRGGGYCTGSEARNLMCAVTRGWMEGDTLRGVKQII